MAQALSKRQGGLGKGFPTANRGGQVCVYPASPTHASEYHVNLLFGPLSLRSAIALGHRPPTEVRNMKLPTQLLVPRTPLHIGAMA